jgi:DNA invertase Pin-like site-specific DNA recombinase
MNDGVHEKIKSNHLERHAYLYIRQSTVRQVFENTESTDRQYALRQRAINLGWPDDQVVVIDSDLGQSGSGTVEREGFQKLVTEVGMGRAGIVLGLEVSRLARNSADWHRLLEFCALTDTLILDEDGVYDPSNFNDRLLLGLKGTMSEAELHVLHSRLRGGLLNKARRGELRLILPVGFVYDNADKIAFDPDRQVQETVKLFFETFNRTGGVYGTTKHFRKEGIQFPTYIRSGPNKGELAWRPLSLNRASHLLHNPIYAGAYVYGRSRHRKQPDGRTKHELLPHDQWQVLIKDFHQGYISWEIYQSIEKRLQKATIDAGFHRKTAPREGPALLQGLAVCGLCGSRMHVRYNKKGDQRITNYVCWARGRGYADPMCQSILGAEIDSAISDLALKTVTPMAIEVSLAVQQEVSQRVEEGDNIRQRQVQRAQYEVDKAKQRYMYVDPTNRLVAESLEAEWNEKLRKLSSTKEDTQRQRIKDRIVIDEEQRKKIMSLVADCPSVWNDPNTPNRERKKMLALLIEDVTLIKEKQIIGQLAK